MPAVAKGVGWSKSNTRRPCTLSPRTKPVTPKSPKRRPKSTGPARKSRKPKRTKSSPPSYMKATKGGAQKEAHAKKQRADLKRRSTRTAPKTQRPTWTRKAGETTKNVAAPARKKRSKAAPKSRPKVNKSILKKTKRSKRGAFTGASKPKSKGRKKVAFSDDDIKIIEITKPSITPEAPAVMEDTPEQLTGRDTSEQPPV